jgi:hypothetical protein
MQEQVMMKRKRYMLPQKMDHIMSIIKEKIIEILLYYISNLPELKNPKKIQTKNDKV